MSLDFYFTSKAVFAPEAILKVQIKRFLLKRTFVT